MGARLDPIWQGYPVVCIATGPSLTVEQCETVRQWRERDGCRVIAINDAYLLAPWADALYFADVRWWQWQNDGIDRPLLGLKAREVKDRFRAFSGMRISIQNGNGSVVDPRVVVMRNLSVDNGTQGQLSTDPTGIYTGQNSGYQAIGVAFLLGGNPIVLLGYDMKFSEDKRAHFFGEHPVKTSPETYRQFRFEFDKLAPRAAELGLQIVNATSDSDLASFPRVSLESVVSCQTATALPA